MSNEFKQGQHLHNITGPNVDGEYVWWTVGKGNCTEIRVIMENGQMAVVPWAYVTFDEQPPVKVNLAMMESVTIKEAL